MKHYKQCLKLYKETFLDDDGGKFAKDLFESCFKYCKYLVKDEKIVSMLFALPCEMVFENKSQKALYIFAVATEKKERGKGYMTALFNNLKSETDALLFLRPASDDLINLYSRLDFKAIPAESIADKIPFVKPTGSFLSLAEKYKTPDNSQFTAMYYGNTCNLEKIYFIYSME